MEDQNIPQMPEQTPEQIERHFSALDDSVAIINSDVDAAAHSDEIDARVWRNWKHIEIMLSKDFIINAGRDLSAYNQAVTKGSAFSPNQPEA